MLENEEPNLIHIQNLIAVAYADGNIDEDEEEFLFDMAEDYGISKGTVKGLLKNADKLHFLVPEDPIDREEQLVNIIFMSMLDGEFHDNEYALCLDVAKKLELTEKDLNEAIALTKKLWEEA